MGATEMGIREAVEQAERIAGTNIEICLGRASRPAGSTSAIAQFEVDLGGHRVEQADIDDLLTEGRRGDRPRWAHGAPRPADALYAGWSTGVKNPLGLHADRLAVDIHVLSADALAGAQSRYGCVRSAHLDVR